MLYSALAFLAGITFFQTLGELPAESCYWLAAALSLVMMKSRLLRASGFAVAGFLWAWWFALQVLQARLPDGLEGVDIAVEGRVLGLPERTGDGTRRFLFRIERYRDTGDWRILELPVRLSWYRDAPDIHAGERWSLRVRLKQPRGFANPGGFDYERWLFSRGIRATGYVRRSTTNRRIDATQRYVDVARWRESLAQRIVATGGDPASNALLTALAVGVRSGISQQQWEILRRTGTNHLIAISGLHVGLVAGLVFLATRKGWSRLGAAQHWPAPRVAAVFAMIAAFCYAMLAGFEVPAQRAMIMVCVWMLTRYWCAAQSPWRVWAIALWIVLLLDPLSVLAAGFWLSFAAVGWIFYLTWGRFGRLSRWRRTCMVQFGLVLGLTPLLWLWFHQVSVIAPLANLVAIPWIGLLVVPLLLIGVAMLVLWPAAGQLVVAGAGHLLGALWFILERLACLPATVMALPAVPIPVLALLGLGLAGVLAARGMPARLAGLALVAAAGCFRPERPAAGELWFTLLDVGQGLAAVIETPNHVLVYDAGAAFPGGFNAGAAAVAPYLVHRGYRRIDRLVISHSDNDHSGGAEAVFSALDVQRIDSGEPQALGWARSTACRAGMQWAWDQIAFEYLAPFDRATGNNASCVLRVEAPDGRVLLLAGDIERPVEHQLVTAVPERLAADILVVPHHGSRTSSTPAFVDAAHPQLALFATGYRNRFGFPKPQVVRRYADIGAYLLNSADSGAIRIRLKRGEPLAAHEYRRQKRRYWH